MVTKPTQVGCWPVSSAWFSLQPGQFHRRQCSRQPALPRLGALHLRLPRVAQVSADCELRSSSGRRSWCRPSLAHGPGLACRRRPAPWLVILGHDKAHRAVFWRLRVFWHLAAHLGAWLRRCAGLCAAGNGVQDLGDRRQLVLPACCVKRKCYRNSNSVLGSNRATFRL